MSGYYIGHNDSRSRAGEMGRLLYDMVYSGMTFSDVLIFEQRLQWNDSSIYYRTYVVRKSQTGKCGGKSPKIGVCFALFGEEQTGWCWLECRKSTLWKVCVRVLVQMMAFSWGPQRASSGAIITCRWWTHSPFFSSWKILFVNQYKICWI